MAHMKFIFAESTSPAGDWNSPQAVEFRKQLDEHREASRQKEALERAKADPVVATKLALLEHRSALARARMKSLMEMAGAHVRTFTRAEEAVFDEAVAETEQINREIRRLVKC